MTTLLTSTTRLRLPLVALTAALALAGCKTDEMATGSIPPDGYRTEYPIVLTEAPETLDIPVGYGSGGLSQATKDSVRAFASDASRRGTSGMVIMAPSGSGNETAAAYVAREVRNQAVAAGLAGSLIEIRPYRVTDPAANAPIRLSYSRIKAVSPPCGLWAGQVLPGTDGEDSGAEFGCATQANLAAMVAEPNDLITPRASTSIPAWRRQTVMDKYGMGEIPSGEYKKSDVTVTSEN